MRNPNTTQNLTREPTRTFLSQPSSSPPSFSSTKTQQAHSRDTQPHSNTTFKAIPHHSCNMPSFLLPFASPSPWIFHHFEAFLTQHWTPYTTIVQICKQHRATRAIACLHALTFLPLTPCFSMLPHASSCSLIEFKKHHSTPKLANSTHIAPLAPNSNFIANHRHQDSS